MKKLVCLILWLSSALAFSQQFDPFNNPLVGAVDGVVNGSDVPRGFYVPGFGYHIITTGYQDVALEEYADRIRRTVTALLDTVDISEGDALAVGFYNTYNAEPFEVLVIFREGQTETWINGEQR